MINDSDNTNVLKMFSKKDMVFISEEEEVAIFKNLDCIGREKLLNSHVRLVVKLAKEYSFYGVDLEDLVSEGCIGLFKAIDKFDYTKGVRFSYYCVFWVKQAVVKALADRSRTIRLPTGATVEYLKILKFIKNYKEQHEGEPSTKEISDATKISVNRTRYILDATKTCISINMKMKDSDDKTIAEVIEDEKNISPSKLVECLDYKNTLTKFISKLNKREQIILNNRFGLQSNDEQTLAEVGAILKLTRERVRQIEEQAIGKLKDMFAKQS